MNLGPLSKTFRRTPPLASLAKGGGSISLFIFRRAAVTAIAAVILSAGKTAYGDISAPTSVEFETLSKTIELYVKELEYPDQTTRDFIQMVKGWENKQNKCVLTSWMEKLAESKEACQQNRISQNQLAEIEENIAEKLSRKIQKEIAFNENLFELADIVKYRQTQCLGYTQLFYILGNSIGLDVKPINVAELRTGASPAGTAHTANIVCLTNDKTIIVDLAPNGFTSIPFILEEEFEKTGDCWKLKNKENRLEIDRKIRILNKNELIAYLYNNRANVYIKQGQYAKAVFCLTKAIEYHPKYAEAFYNRGIAYRHLDQLNQAISDYTKAIELNPNFTEAYTNRGIAYSRLDQFNDAISDYTRAIEINPNFAGAYYNRGIAYSKLGQPNQAIVDYDHTIKLNAALAAKAYGNRGISFATLGKSEDARKDLLKAAELNSELKEYAKAAIDHFKLNANLN